MGMGWGVGEIKQWVELRMICSLYLDVIISVFWRATILKLCAGAPQGAAGYFKLRHKKLIGPNYLTRGSVRYGVHFYKYTIQIHNF